MSRRTRQVIDKCIECKKCKSNSYTYGVNPATLHEKVPLSTVSSDILGPFQGDDLNETDNIPKFFLISIVDCCTRTAQISFAKKITGSEIVEAFERWNKSHGKPKKIITDQGRQYCSKTFKDWCNENEIKHCPNSPFNPQGNSIVERQNSYVANIVRMFKKNSPKNIEDIINFAVNNSHHRRLGFSPSKLREGRSIWDPWKRHIETDFEKIAKQMERFSKADHDRKKHIKPFDFKISDFVFQDSEQNEN